MDSLRGMVVVFCNLVLSVVKPSFGYTSLKRPSAERQLRIEKDEPTRKTSLLNRSVPHICLWCMFLLKPASNIPRCMGSCSRTLNRMWI